MHGWYHEEQFCFSGSCNWKVLWEYIDRNGLGGVLGSVVIDELCEVPEDIVQLSTHRYFSNQMHFEQALNCCRELAQAASKLKIPVRVLKGPALALQGYVDTGTRSFSDIDVFVDSAESVQRLRVALAGSGYSSPDSQNIIEKLGESETAKFFLNNWELEFRYPLEPPGEPMFEILSHHSSVLLRVPQESDDVLRPDPSLHLVFLIQHMAVHHLFSRFFWFLDLAVLIRNCREQIDFILVEEELKRLGLINVAAVAADFCRKYIDPDFPRLGHSVLAWNNRIMVCFADPVNIARGRFGIYHKKYSHKFLGYLVGVVSFYLIADPDKKRFFGFATNWTLNRFRNSFGFDKPIVWVDFLLKPVIALLLVPLAWGTALCLTKKDHEKMSLSSE